MFGREEQGPQAPPYRTFKVTRYHLTGEGLETVTISAHSLKYGPSGILIFDEGMVVRVGHEVELVERITRVFRTWEEVEEITTPTTSSLYVS
jgi:hypothetical protein